VDNGLCTTIKYLRGAAGTGLGTTIKYLRRSTSGAAGNGLRTTIKYLRGAAGIGLGTTIKCLRCTMSAAANNGLESAGHHDHVPRETKRERGQQLDQGPITQKLGTNSEESPCSVAAHVVNSEPHIGARPSVRLSVGPELAPCVHRTIV
jgi:hypothetical protein